MVTTKIQMPSFDEGKRHPGKGICSRKGFLVAASGLEPLTYGL
jgi:hypothetical protein